MVLSKLRLWFASKNPRFRLRKLDYFNMSQPIFIASYVQLCRAAYYGETAARVGAPQTPAQDLRFIRQVQSLPSAVFQSVLAAWNIGYDFQSKHGATRAALLATAEPPYTN